MSIFNNTRTKDLHRVGYDSIRPVELLVSSEETGARLDYTTDRNKEWAVELRLRQNYWANDVQRPEVEKVAIRALAHALYEDVLRELPRLRLAIQSGDKAGAMEAVLDIEKATQP